MEQIQKYPGNQELFKKLGTVEVINNTVQVLYFEYKTYLIKYLK